jgi:hypothetical protein
VVSRSLHRVGLGDRARAAQQHRGCSESDRHSSTPIHPEFLLDNSRRRRHWSRRPGDAGTGRLKER